MKTARRRALARMLSTVESLCATAEDLDRDGRARMRRAARRAVRRGVVLTAAELLKHADCRPWAMIRKSYEDRRKVQSHQSAMAALRYCVANTIDPRFLGLLRYDPLSW